MLPALLPFLVTRFDLNYTQVGALMLVSALASSIIQPAFGLWSDRRGAVWLLPVGVFLAGTGMGLLPQRRATRSVSCSWRFPGSARPPTTPRAPSSLRS